MTFAAGLAVEGAALWLLRRPIAALGRSGSLRLRRRDPDDREEWESHPEIAGLLGPPTDLQERQFATLGENVHPSTEDEIRKAFGADPGTLGEREPVAARHVEVELRVSAQGQERQRPQSRHRPRPR